MKRLNLNDLNIFIIVAQYSSFTKAAARLNMTQSSISHAIRRLEEDLHLRLVTRTTRHVSLTDAGEELFYTLTHAFGEIDQKLAALSQLNEKPSGTIRITCAPIPAPRYLWPVVEEMMLEYPDIHFEISIEAKMVDIITQRFDAGIRLGNYVEKDMISVAISPDIRMCVVGSPAYFEKYTFPEMPQDLADHNCINMRLPSSGDLYLWAFTLDEQPINVRVDGGLVVNDSNMIIKAALAGLGLGYVMYDQVQDYLQDGHLISVLDDYLPTLSGYHLYYPSRRQHTQAFKLLIDRLRYRQKPL